MSKHKYEEAAIEYDRKHRLIKMGCSDELIDISDIPFKAFLAGCDHVEKLNNEKISSLINGAARDNEIINKQAEVIERLTRALGFYADKDNWHDATDFGIKDTIDNTDWSAGGELDGIGGVRARQALEDVRRF